MAFLNRTWTAGALDPAASLDAANYVTLAAVETNQTDYVLNGLALNNPSITSNGANFMRVDSGNLTFANPECVIGTQNVDINGGSTAEQQTNNVGVFVNGGTLNIAGSANENDPHLFLKINGPIYSPTGDGPFQTSQAGIALTEGTLNIGTEATPFCKIVSSKGLTVDPDGGEIQSDFLNTGNCILNVQSLVLQNPHQDGVADNLLPNLGFRNSSTGYVVGGSSFDTAILDGYNILDVSGTGATNAGMLPTNVVFRRGSFVGDNGSIVSGRGNNALGFAYVGADGNTAAQEFLINTEDDAVGLANTNWFVVGNSDVVIRANARNSGRYAGLVANRLITIESASGGSQSYYIPETNSRFTNSEVSAVDNVTGQTDLGGFAFTPTGVTAPANSIPIGGTNGRFSVTGTTNAAPIRVRMLSRFQIGSGLTIQSITTHQDNEYIYFGNQDLALGVQTLNYYQGGVQDLSVSIPDTTDPIIDVLKANSIATTAIAGATVVLPALGAADTATTTVTLNEATNVNISVGRILATVKAALVTRLNTGVNTTVQATAEQYINNWLDKIVNATSPITVTNAGAGSVGLSSDAAYNNGLDTSIGETLGGAITTGDNVALFIEPATVDFSAILAAESDFFAAGATIGRASWAHTNDYDNPNNITASSLTNGVLTITGLSLNDEIAVAVSKPGRSNFRQVFTFTGGNAIVPTLTAIAAVDESTDITGVTVNGGREDSAGLLIFGLTGATTANSLDGPQTVWMTELMKSKQRYNLGLLEGLAMDITHTSPVSSQWDETVFVMEPITTNQQVLGISSITPNNPNPVQDNGTLSIFINGSTEVNYGTIDDLFDANLTPITGELTAITNHVNEVEGNQQIITTNQGVLLTATQRGAVKAAAYSAGEITPAANIN